MNTDEINLTFHRRKAESDCPMCPDREGPDVIATLPSGHVHLQNDRDYLGYCTLIFHRHAIELFDLTSDERAQWIEDIARIEQAIVTVCEPAKFNITMLGNMVPHLHCHILPRYSTDPEWGHPPAYRRPAERNLLTPEDYEELKAALSQAFAMV